jgi:hypothetical protein
MVEGAARRTEGFFHPIQTAAVLSMGRSRGVGREEEQTKARTAAAWEEAVWSRSRGEVFVALRARAHAHARARSMDRSRTATEAGTESCGCVAACVSCRRRGGRRGVAALPARRCGDPVLGFVPWPLACLPSSVLPWLLASLNWTNGRAWEKNSDNRADTSSTVRDRHSIGQQYRSVSPDATDFQM